MKRVKRTLLRSSGMRKTLRRVLNIYRVPVNQAAHGHASTRERATMIVDEVAGECFLIRAWVPRGQRVRPLRGAWEPFPSWVFPFWLRVVPRPVSRRLGRGLLR